MKNIFRTRSSPTIATKGRMRSVPGFSRIVSKNVLSPFSVSSCFLLTAIGVQRWRVFKSNVFGLRWIVVSCFDSAAWCHDSVHAELGRGPTNPYVGRFTHSSTTRKYDSLVSMIDYVSERQLGSKAQQIRLAARHVSCACRPSSFNSAWDCQKVLIDGYYFTHSKDMCTLWFCGLKTVRWTSFAIRRQATCLPLYPFSLLSLPNKTAR